MKEAVEDQDSSQSTPKKETNKKAKEPVEKRLKRFRSSCPQMLEDRMARARVQRLFCLGQHVNGPHSREYDILGSTGNVYQVKLEKILSCTCPDFTRGHHCKHLFFVMTRVVRAKDKYVYQAALLTKELEEIFQGTTLDQRSLASERIRQRYESVKKDKEPPATPQRELSDCPICFEECGEADRASCVFCRVCNNNTHRECFKIWMDTNRSKGVSVTCVYCRSSWQEEGKDAGSSVNIKDGFVNLGTEY